MIRIEYKNGENEIFNSAGHQLHGAPAAGLSGLNPRELLEASLGLCMSLVMVKVLERDGIPYQNEQFDFEVDAQKDPDGGNFFSGFTVKMNFPDVDDKYKEKLKKLIERGCTISNTLQTEAKIEIVEK